MGSELLAVETLDDIGRAFASLASFSAEESVEIGLAVREAAANAVSHGNHFDPDKTVTVEFRITKLQLVIALSDQGNGFSAESVKDPLHETNLLNPSGRGLLLMQAIMDNISFSSSGPFGMGHGTTITLTKNRKILGAYMEINLRQSEGVTILDLSGKVTLGESTGQLRGAIHDAIAAGARKIVLHLERVTYVDSAGLGELVSSYTTVKNAGGTLKLLKLSKKVNDLLVITKLLTVFEVSEDEKATIASFA